MRRIAARGNSYRVGHSIKRGQLLSSSPSLSSSCRNHSTGGVEHRHRSKRRVAITGLGVISPLGHDLQSTWQGVLRTQDSIKNNIEPHNYHGITSLHSALRHQNLSVDQFEKEWEILQPLSCQVAASVPYEWIKNHPLAHLSGEMQPSPPWLDGRTARFVQLALIAAQEAIHNSALHDWLNSHDQQQQIMSSHLHETMRESYGVSIGNGMSSTRDISMTSFKNIHKISPHFVPQILPNSPAARIAIHHKLHGPNISHSEACAAGAAAIAQAVEMIQWGRVKGMVAGGCESAVEALGLAGFSRLRALSTSSGSDNANSSRRPGSDDGQREEHNHENDIIAQTSSCPFDSKRNGFVLAEGAAMLVLEEYDHAVARGAPILAEVLGVGYSGDAFHITAPEPTGKGAARAMLQAVEDAGLSMNCVDYINTHATSTPMGDVAEINAIRLALDRTHIDEEGNASSSPLLVSSTKGATGHLLGAAGAIEAALTVMAVSKDTAPHTRNLEEISDDVKQALERFTDDDDATTTTTTHRSIHLVQHEPLSQTIDAAISNSFGFGGTNVSLLFGKAQ
jgi:3-oxoacyl-[acyl-carrier-protein] synthase II